MSDSIGLVSLPVAAPTTTPPNDRTLAAGDPARVLVGSFAAVVLQSALGDAWTALSPGKPDLLGGVDGERDGTSAARRCLFSNPRAGRFSPEDLPGLFVYRAAQATALRIVEDADRLRTQMVVAWVLPPTDDHTFLRERESFLHAALAALRHAFGQKRHPAWVVDTDLADPDGLKTAFATSTTAVTVSSFDGALAGQTMKSARPISVTTAPAVGAYNTADPIEVTGTLANGLSFTERVYLTEPNGGETVQTVFPFASPTTAELPEMLTTTGSITIGYADSPDVRKGSLLQRACAFREMRLVRAVTQPIQVQRPGEETRTFEALELFLDVGEDAFPDPDLRAYAPWDIEAHGQHGGEAVDVFEFIIED